MFYKSKYVSLNKPYNYQKLHGNLLISLTLVKGSGNTYFWTVMNLCLEEKQECKVVFMWSS